MFLIAGALIRVTLLVGFWIFLGAFLILHTRSCLKRLRWLRNSFFILVFGTIRFHPRLNFVYTTENSSNISRNSQDYASCQGWNVWKRTLGHEKVHLTPFWYFFNPIRILIVNTKIYTLSMCTCVHYFFRFMKKGIPSLGHTAMNTLRILILWRVYLQKGQRSNHQVPELNRRPLSTNLTVFFSSKINLPGMVKRCFGKTLL